MSNKDLSSSSLPDCVTGYIRRVVLRMGYSRKVRAEVRQELTDHFIDALADCSDQDERRSRAEQLIAQFGDAKLLARLIRRGKKRCRPLWKKVIIRTAQSFGAFILLFIGYSAWFFTGQATLSTDYLAHLNQMGRPDVPDSQDAWPYYSRASELYIEPPEQIEDLVDSCTRRYHEPPKDISALSERERELILAWLEENDPAWREFVTAGKMPYCHWQYEGLHQGDWLITIHLPHLRPLHGVAKLGIWRSRFASSQGHTEQALEDCLAVACTGRHWQKKGTLLIEQSTGLSISYSAHQEILRIVAKQSLTSTELQRLQRRLSDLYPPDAFMRDMEGERLIFLDTVQRVFTKGGPGGGHLIPKEVNQIVPHEFFSEPVITVAGSMLHVRRDQCTDLGNKLYDKMNEIMQMSPYQHRSQVIDEDIETELHSLPRHRFFLLQKLMPSVDGFANSSFRGKALHEASLCILALRRWYLDNDSYPERLDQLLDFGYLDSLPLDPYSDGPLRYQRRRDDFVLYSVGADFVDDNGVAYPAVNLWEPEYGDSSEPGDRVFWPLMSR